MDVKPKASALDVKPEASALDVKPKASALAVKPQGLKSRISRKFQAESTARFLLFPYGPAT